MLKEKSCVPFHNTNTIDIRTYGNFPLFFVRLVIISVTLYKICFIMPKYTRYTIMIYHITYVKLIIKFSGLFLFAGSKTIVNHYARNKMNGERLLLHLLFNFVSSLEPKRAIIFLLYSVKFSTGLKCYTCELDECEKNDFRNLSIVNCNAVNNISRMCRTVRNNII